MLERVAVVVRVAHAPVGIAAQVAMIVGEETIGAVVAATIADKYPLIYNLAKANPSQGFFIG